MNKDLVKKHFDTIALNYDEYQKRNWYYHKTIERIYKSIIPKRQIVIELGSATGALLNAVEPRIGLGVDFSVRMIEISQKKYPHLRFIQDDIESFQSEQRFDYMIMSNVLDHVEDIWQVFDNAKRCLNEDAKIIITTVNPVWEPIFRLGNKFGLKTPDTTRNFITNKDIVNLLRLHDLDVIKEGLKFFIPKKIPLIAPLFNFFIPEIPFLRQLCAVQYIVAKVKRSKKIFSCSVVVPCFNEADNIEICIKRTPKMGNFTEIIVVDDGSTDNTSEKVKSELNSELEIKLIKYNPNKGKGHAVKTGFDQAKGDILMILDADIAVVPEELPRFYQPLAEGVADFINGTRYVYPMEEKAMKILNYGGNKIFSIILSWIMEQRISDTLCGTKALFKKDYEKITMGRDPWGDFDLLFGGAKLKLKIMEMPVHYKERIAGQSKMKAFRHGLILLKMCWLGFRELKIFK